MRKLLTITPIRVGFQTVVNIPESWDAFTFNGFLYVRGEDRRFVMRAKVNAA